MGEDLRIGVWICECGGNIGDVVDVPGLAERLKSEVAYVREERYLCSSPSIDAIKDAVEKRRLDRVVLACCTPNMHRETFKSNLEEVGLNPALFEMVNIREQCSWVHKEDHEGATQKSLDLIRGAIARAKESTPLESKEMEVNPEVLVIGAGVAGITSSLRLSEYGMKVHLVEKRPSIGGHMIQFPKVFPTLDCSQCILTPKMAQVNQSRNIDLMSYAEVSEVKGVPGDFDVKVRVKPRGVDVEECIGCGACSRVCPTEVPDDFNEGLGARKAAYIPFPQSVPSVYTIDFDHCTKCGACTRVCPKQCIDLVVLCPPIVTTEETLRLAEMLRVPVDEDQFVLERHPKLDPMATKRDGIFAAGTVVGPKDIQTTTAEAEGAAMKVVNFLSTDRVIEPNKAFLAHPDLCDGCGDCVDDCPEAAITLEDEKPVINEIMCTGCGACIPACPQNALDQQGLTDDQLRAQIKGSLEDSEAEIKILAFVEREVAYTAVDLAGLARLSYPSSIRIIPLPSLSRLKLDHLLHAFAQGADGVMLLEAPEHEGPYGRAHIISEERADDYKWELEDHDIDSVRLWFSRAYVPDWRKLERVFRTFHGMIEDEGPVEEEIRESLKDRSD